MLKEKANNTELNFLVALDGPAASGKGVVGSQIAKLYCLTYYSSSIFYRKLAGLALNLGFTKNQDIISLSADVERLLDYTDENLHRSEISMLASKFGAIEEVRANLYHAQRKIVETNPRLIMEGRDIGSVIAPEAHLKIYLTASLEVRALRRFLQLKSQNIDFEKTYDTILLELAERDKRDQERKTAPLKKASNAFFIDNSTIDIDSTLNFIKNYVECN
ncbi:MAG: (d)CMP kinase [Rickettsiaceae bacterium]|nr:(d)CMP kinase [Rickettsiaceae bacterium]